MAEILINSLAAVGGVGGLLAALMFYFYNKNEKTNMATLERYNRALSEANLQLIGVVKENTVAMTQMQATTAALGAAVAELTRDLRERDQYFREHILPIVARKVNS